MKAQRALSDQRDRTVEVNRLKLIETLKTNREKHAKSYEAAILGYKGAAISKLQEANAEAHRALDKNLQKCLIELQDFNPERAEQQADRLILVQQFAVDLKVPRNYTDSYDAAIALAEWDVRETLELSYSEFQCFVRDIWDWTEEFHMTAMSYSR